MTDESQEIKNATIRALENEIRRQDAARKMMEQEANELRKRVELLKESMRKTGKEIERLRAAKSVLEKPRMVITDRVPTQIEIVETAKKKIEKEAQSKCGYEGPPQKTRMTLHEQIKRGIMPAPTGISKKEYIMIGNHKVQKDYIDTAKEFIRGDDWKYSSEIRTELMRRYNITRQTVNTNLGKIMKTIKCEKKMDGPKKMYRIRIKKPSTQEELDEWREIEKRAFMESNKKI